jgi:tetratricopeptide (TPR) repeat protein
MPEGRAPFAGERVAFAGRLGCLSRADAEALVRRLGGRVARGGTPSATLLIVGDEGEPGRTRRRRAGGGFRRATRDGPRVLTEGEFCARAGIPSSADLRQRYHPLREIRARYPRLREDHIRYLERWGLIRPAEVTQADRWYAFGDLALLASIHASLEGGASFRAAVNERVAEREGQLALNLAPRTPGATVLPFPGAEQSGDAEGWFLRGAELESLLGGAEAAEGAYAAALRLDPDLVPALINLANLLYLRNELERAFALYRRAEALAGDAFFQIPFNLANIAYDREDYREARRLYERALELEPEYADAHVYLALTLEKLGLSARARPHWRAYCRLEPRGEWVKLAREMDRAD